MELNINKAFRDALPAMTTSETLKLRESLLLEGCREPLLVWNGTIIDGHNRYRLCQELGVPFEIQQVEFESDESALYWILLNQLGRRNIHANARAEVLGRYNLLRSKGHGGFRDHSDASKGQVATVATSLRTREIIAKEAGVSPRTIQNATAYVKALDALPEDEKEKARAGEMSQKEVIEKANPKPEPTPTPGRTTRAQIARAGSCPNCERLRRENEELKRQVSAKG